MKYNGIELEEMTPKKWNGKSREMLVWDDTSKKPFKKIVVGYGPRRNRWMSVEGNYWQCCAEIPKEEPADDLKAQVHSLKAENEELKAKIKSLLVARGKMANAVSGAVWKEMMDIVAKQESLIGVQMPDGLGFNDISDIVLNKILNYKPENGSEKKFRRMTNRELAKWCAEGKGIFKNDDGNMTYTDFGFNSNEMNEPVGGWIRIRGWNETEWHEPLIEE